MKHPLQPLEKDAHGHLRFKANAIVCYLLDNGGIDMNALAVMQFSDDDREQFAQLIGYSLNGFGELGYVSTETFDAAQRTATGTSSSDARLEYCHALIESLKDSLRGPMAELFEMHPDDLKGHK